MEVVRFAYYDLLTGKREADECFIVHFDPNVVNWVDARPDHLLHVLNKNDWQNPRFVGAREIRNADFMRTAISAS